MIMGDINMKIWFLILVAVVLSGCESPQVARQSEMAEARQMVRAQFGGQLTPQQEAYLSMQVFQQLEAQRARAIAPPQTVVYQQPVWQPVQQQAYVPVQAYYHPPLGPSPGIPWTSAPVAPIPVTRY